MKVHSVLAATGIAALMGLASQMGWAGVYQGCAVAHVCKVIAVVVPLTGAPLEDVLRELCRKTVTAHQYSR